MVERLSGIATATLATCGIVVAVMVGVLVYSERIADREAQATELSLLNRKVQALEARLVRDPALDGLTTVTATPAAASAGDHGKGDKTAMPAVSSAKGEQSQLVTDGVRRERESPAQAAERQQHERHALEDALLSQTLDVAWSNAVAEHLKEGLNDQLMAGTQLVDAQCRETFCRVAVLHKSDEDMAAFLDGIGTIEDFDNTEFYWQREPNADGSSSMTLFVARQGQTLPNFRMQ